MILAWINNNPSPLVIVIDMANGSTEIPSEILKLNYSVAAGICARRTLHHRRMHAKLKAINREDSNETHLISFRTYANGWDEFTQKISMNDEYHSAKIVIAAETTWLDDLDERLYRASEVDESDPNPEDVSRVLGVLSDSIRGDRQADRNRARDWCEQFKSPSDKMLFEFGFCLADGPCREEEPLQLTDHSDCGRQSRTNNWRDSVRILARANAS